MLYREIIAVCSKITYKDISCGQNQEFLDVIPGGGGKQWQTTPKNLPRMQRTRAIPVDWLGSGSCPNKLKGWILIINNNTWWYVCFP